MSAFSNGEEVVISLQTESGDGERGENARLHIDRRSGLRLFSVSLKFEINFSLIRRGQSLRRQERCGLSSVNVGAAVVVARCADMVMFVEEATSLRMFILRGRTGAICPRGVFDLGVGG